MRPGIVHAGFDNITGIGVGALLVVGLATHWQARVLFRLFGWPGFAIWLAGGAVGEALLLRVEDRRACGRHAFPVILVIPQFRESQPIPTGACSRPTVFANQLALLSSDAMSSVCELTPNFL
jgi:hypothetical protein